MASWATSSASSRLRKSQRARLKAESRCGSTHSSNRFLSSRSNTPKTASVVPFSYNYRGFDFIPFHGQVQRKESGAGSKRKRLVGGLPRSLRWGHKRRHFARLLPAGRDDTEKSGHLPCGPGIKTWSPRSPMTEHVQRWREFVISFQACAIADGT